MVNRKKIKLKLSNILVGDKNVTAVEIVERILVVAVVGDEVLGMTVVLLVVGLKYLKYGVVRTVGFTERVMGMMIGGRDVVVELVEATVVLVELVVVMVSEKKLFFCQFEKGNSEIPNSISPTLD